MANILVVTGSARPNSVNSKVVPEVVNIINSKNHHAVVAKLAELELPYLNSEFPPSHPNFKISNDNVKRWTEMVESSDAVILVMPEYNHTMSPIQLNAVDWVGKQWEEKPVGFVSYGWSSGGKMATATAKEAFSTTLKAKPLTNEVNLFFNKDISPDGKLLNVEDTKNAIGNLVDEIHNHYVVS